MWMNKEGCAVCVYTHTHTHTYTHTVGYYSAIIKMESMPFMNSINTLINIEGIMFSEVSLTEKDKHYMISLLSGI